MAILGSSGCSFPDYAFSGPAPFGGSSGSSNAGAPSGSGGELSAGSGGNSGGAGGAGGSPTIGGSGGAGGNSGSAGDGGDAGAPAVSKKCADFPLLPEQCGCADDATHAYFFCRTTRTFSSAAAQCRFSDMHLVTVSSLAEETWIMAEAKKMTVPAPFQYFWIGASSTESPGTWHWTDGSLFWQGGANGMPTSGDVYYNWRTDYPQITSSERCVHVQDGWQDGDCTQNRPFVCEAD